ncbi:MAG: ABC transporter substrate-binding protein [Desulfurococcales archaeon]|jgi:iron complex transport system substrate-binding protein|nr:ABC transporter substrate-binding protein [Desulfurococcales archaeon]
MVNSSKILGVGVIIAIAISIISTVYMISAVSGLREGLNKVSSDINSLSQSISRNISRISSAVEDSLTSIGYLNRSMISIETSIRDLNSSITRINGSLASLGEILRASSGPRVDIKYARLFQVMYDGPAKIVKDAEGQTILLLPRSLSSQKEVVGVYVSRYSPQLVIYTPVERVILMSATQVAMLLRLESECNVDIFNRTILGVMWGKMYTWYIPRIADMLDKGLLKDFGWADNPNIEAMIAAKPDLVVIYTYAGSPVFRSLKGAGLPVVVDNEYLEQSFLGRFEWIKFLALFYNLDGCVESLFRRVENTIYSLRSSIIDIAPTESQRPLIAWFNVFRGRIYAAAPSSYVVDAINLAGGRYAFIDIPYGMVSQEIIIARSSSIDVLIYSTSKEYGPKSIEELIKAVLFVSDLKAVREKKVYVFAPTYWQLGTAYPEDILRDLMKIFYPGLRVLSEWNIRFFEKLE